MKSTERHELKENELAEWFMNLPTWFSQTRNTVIFSGIAVIIIIVALVWYLYQKRVIEPGRNEQFTELIVQLPMFKPRLVQSSMAGQDATSNLLDLITKLQSSADNSTNPRMAAVAYIEIAKALRTGIHYQIETPDKGRVVEQLNKAKDYCNLALTKLGAPSSDGKRSLEPSLEAQAMYEIGLCEEEMGNITAASKQYESIVKNPVFQYSTSFVEATRRLAIISDFAKPVVFKPNPIVIKPLSPVEVNKPATGAASVDMNALLRSLSDSNLSTTVIR